MKKIILLMVSLIFLLNTISGQRKVLLLHGLNGFKGQWDVYQPYLTNLLNVPPTPIPVCSTGYSSQNGVNASVTELLNPYMSSGFILSKGTTSSIAIGQSMGGVVLRQIDSINPGVYFGGLITLGSPNRGGQILNNIPQVKSFLISGCNKAGVAVSTTLAAGLSFSPFTSFTILGTTLTLSSLFCNLPISIDNKSIGAPLLIDQYNPFGSSSASANDLKLGSSIINNLNALNTTTPKIGIYGVEQSPVHWRQIGSIFEGDQPWTLPLNVTGGERLKNTMQTVRDVSQVTEVLLWTSGVVNTTLAVVYGFSLNWLGAAMHGYIAVMSYIAAGNVLSFKNWLDNSESTYNQIIGAGGFFTEKEFRLEFTQGCEDQINNLYSMLDDRTRESMRNYGNVLSQIRALRQSPTCYENVLRDVSYPINNESDGLFNAGTQRIPEDPDDRLKVINLPVSGVNHAEFFNHPNMTKRFRNIFELRYIQGKEKNPFFTSLTNPPSPSIP